MSVASHVGVTPIVALDVSTFDDAIAIVRLLGEHCRFYKVGSELFTSTGPQIVTALRELGCRVFLDLKFHDIPNTVCKAAAAAARAGASLITVHASGGEAMVRAAVEGAGEGCAVFAVTILTSLDAKTLGEAWDKPRVEVEREVVRLAELAARSGAAGVVCSGHEAATLHERFGRSLQLLVPGIRLAGSSADDQARVVTPGDAAAAGASYIILGRTVTQGPDPAAAMQAASAALGDRSG
jgi:orotidine-5'-phosphate decarboxylase